MTEPYLYRDQPHVVAFNTLVDQGILFVEASAKDALKKLVFGIMYGASPAMVPPAGIEPAPPHGRPGFKPGASTSSAKGAPI